MGGEGGNEGTDGMKVKLDVTIGLSMGGICVTVGDGVEVMSLTQAVQELIAGQEVGDEISSTGLTILRRVMMDMNAAVHLLADRVEIEGDKVRARG